MDKEKYQKQYYLDNKDLYKKYYLDNIEQIKQYYLDNIEKIIVYDKNEVLLYEEKFISTVDFIEFD